MLTKVHGRQLYDENKQALYETLLNGRNYIIIAFIASIGASIGISFGRHVLNRINEQIFKRLMNSMLIVFGCYFFMSKRVC